MAEFSKIAWTDGTFNPWIGCTRVSPGCENCYAENLMDRRYHRVKWGRGQPRMRTKTWNDPMKWNRQAEKEGIRKRVFCASLADYLDEEVPAQWREDLFDLMLACPSIDWLMLTKRIENAALMLPLSWATKPPANFWCGVTAENQKYWDIRVPILKTVNAVVRWVSYEPALGPIDIRRECGVDWVIIGGESAQTMPARPFNPWWAESVIQQCRSYQIAPFVKQMGTGPQWKDKAGADPAEWPEVVRVREFPTPRSI